jgi:rare lipoprotein A
MQPSLRHTLSLLALAVLTAACSTSTPSGTALNDATVNTASAADEGGKYKVGEPYQVNGVWYYPNEDYGYDETGIASWYGGEFHGRRTANGETFDANELTAAHPTLPMPSLARVTNLDNGRSLVVRVNDRGPFRGGRLVDVSRRVAQMLGFEKSGTAKVRLQVLTDESKAIASAAGHYGTEQASRAYAQNSTKRFTRAAPRQKVQIAALPPVSDYQPAQPIVAKTTPNTAMPALPPITSTESILAARQELPVVTQVPVKPNPQIYVQAGAFSQMNNAEQLKRSLRGICVAEIDRTMVADKTFYRVRVGPLANADKAKTMLQQIAQAGVANPRIVVD